MGRRRKYMSTIIHLVKAYQASVDYAVNELRESLSCDDLLKGFNERTIPQEGELVSGNSYYFHGVGCVFTLKGRDVNFDFGPSNRNDGFDLWRLEQFVDEHADKYELFYNDKEELKQEFCRLERDGIIFNPKWFPGTSLYYFK